MKVNVHIDRLVIDGAGLTRAQRAALAAAAQRELSLLLGGQAPGTADSGTAARHSGGPPGASSRLRDVAVAIAAEIYRALPASTAGPPGPAAPLPRTAHTSGGGL
jgi:hypothetical protein